MSNTTLPMVYISFEKAIPGLYLHIRHLLKYSRRYPCWPIATWWCQQETLRLL